MFVILAHQRTGTHLLGSLLNSHPDLRCYDEIFLVPGNRFTPFGRKPFEEIRENEGCIVMYTQYLRQKKHQKAIRRAKVIHLIRKNLSNHANSLRMSTFAAKRTIEGLQNDVFKDEFDSIFELSYEDICQDTDIKEYENNELLDFLGVKPRILTTSSVKGIDPRGEGE